MGQPIHYPIRERIVLLRSQGHSIKEISAELQLSFWTIRHLLRRHRDGGDKGLGPDYSRCGAKGEVRAMPFSTGPAVGSSDAMKIGGRPSFT